MGITTLVSHANVCLDHSQMQEILKAIITAFYLIPLISGTFQIEILGLRGMGLSYAHTYRQTINILQSGTPLSSFLK